MSRLWQDHPWLDLVTAAVLAVLMFNLHVTTRGDALSSLERGDRRGFYAVVAVLAVILFAATLARRFPTERWCRGCLGFASLAAVSGMLLDVQDGPVRTVQLVVLLGLFLTVMVTIRFILYLDEGPGS